MESFLLEKPDEHSFEKWLDFICTVESLSEDQRESLRTHAMAIARVFLKLTEETDLIERCAEGEWDFYKMPEDSDETHQ